MIQRNLPSLAAPWDALMFPKGRKNDKNAAPYALIPGQGVKFHLFQAVERSWGKVIWKLFWGQEQAHPEDKVILPWKSNCRITWKTAREKIKQERKRRPRLYNTLRIAHPTHDVAVSPITRGSKCFCWSLHLGQRRQQTFLGYKTNAFSVTAA